MRALTRSIFLDLHVGYTASGMCYRHDLSAAQLCVELHGVAGWLRSLSPRRRAIERLRAEVYAQRVRSART